MDASVGEPEHAVNLCKVCASVAHRWAEAAALMKSKQPKLTLEGPNGRWKLGLLLWPRKQTAVLSVKKLIFSTPKESKAS
jgi:hypothetical protein